MNLTGLYIKNHTQNLILTIFILNKSLISQSSFKILYNAILAL